MMARPGRSRPIRARPSRLGISREDAAHPRESGGPVLSSLALSKEKKPRFRTRGNERITAYVRGCGVIEGLGFSAFGLRFSLLLLTWPLAMAASFEGGNAKLGSVAANRKRGLFP